MKIFSRLKYNALAEGETLYFVYKERLKNGKIKETEEEFTIEQDNEGLFIRDIVEITQANVQKLVSSGYDDIIIDENKGEIPRRIITQDTLNACIVNKHSDYPAMIFDNNISFQSINFKELDIQPNFGHAIFGKGARFDKATFDDKIRFDKTVFKNTVDFANAMLKTENPMSMVNATWFHNTTFGDEARFDSATFVNQAWFDSATFGDRAQFDNTKFIDSPLFTDAKFGNETRFVSATFGDKARFSGAKFDDEAQFNSTKFGNEALFNNTEFGNNTQFSNAKFGDGAFFGSAKFGDKTNFNQVTFGDNTVFRGITFGDEALFGSAKFGDATRFDDATFNNETRFDGATFGDNTVFRDTTFGDNTQFVTTAHYDNTLIGMKFGNNTVFDNAKFADNTVFRGTTFGDNTGFRGTTFDDGTLFHGATFGDEAQFNDAKFGNKTRFNGITFDRLSFYGTVFLAVNLNGLNDEANLKNNDFILDLQSSSIQSAIFDDLKLKSTNAANRETLMVLKNLAIKQNDNIKALEFHTLEMDRYYLDLKKGSEKSLDKFILWFEKRVSYFGTNYFRALICYIGWALCTYGLILLLGKYWSWESIESFSKIWSWESIKSFINYFLPISYDLNKIFDGSGVKVNICVRLFFIFYKVIQFALLYEIIKSFRKYSRKL